MRSPSEESLPGLDDIARDYPYEEFPLPYSSYGSREFNESNPDPQMKEVLNTNDQRHISPDGLVGPFHKTSVLDVQYPKGNLDDSFGVRNVDNNGTDGANENTANGNRTPDNNDKHTPEVGPVIGLDVNLQTAPFLGYRGLSTFTPKLILPAPPKDVLASPTPPVSTPAMRPFIRRSIAPKGIDLPVSVGLYLQQLPDHLAMQGAVPGLDMVDIGFGRQGYESSVLLPAAYPVTSGLESDVKKVAPRSKDLFRVGPPFGSTRVLRKLYSLTGEQVIPCINARIDRGFELGEAGNWIGYKRNYFTMVLTFTIPDWDLDHFCEEHYHIYAKGDRTQKLDVQYFALRVVVKCSDPDQNVGLVQHTPKRDKGPQYLPPVYPAVPGELPDHQTVKALCNKRNYRTVRSLGRIFTFNRAEYYEENQVDAKKDKLVLKGYPDDIITKVARFERIQFSASIRVKYVSDKVHKYYTLNVELVAVTKDEDRTILVPVASCASAPLLIRGRSPSMYPREKTSGYRGDGIESEM